MPPRAGARLLRHTHCQAGISDQPPRRSHRMCPRRTVPLSPEAASSDRTDALPLSVAASTSGTRKHERRDSSEANKRAARPRQRQSFSAHRPRRCEAHVLRRAHIPSRSLDRRPPGCHRGVLSRRFSCRLKQRSPDHGAGSRRRRRIGADARRRRRRDSRGCTAVRARRRPSPAGHPRLPRSRGAQTRHRRRGACNGRPPTFGRSAARPAMPRSAASTSASATGAWPPATTRSPPAHQAIRLTSPQSTNRSTDL
jgi:hypothetical protein